MTGRPGLAARIVSQVPLDVLLGVVRHLDGDDDDVGLVVERLEVLGRVVARLVEAAGVEEGRAAGPRRSGTGTRG